MIINMIITNMDRYLRSKSKDKNQVAYVMPPDFNTENYNKVPDESKLGYCKNACSGIFIGTDSPIYKEIYDFIDSYGKVEVNLLEEAKPLHTNDDYKALKDVDKNGNALYYIKKINTGNSYRISRKALQLLGFDV